MIIEQDDDEVIFVVTADDVVEVVPFDIQLPTLEFYFAIDKSLISRY